MTDTHTHLYLPDFEDGGVQVKNALEAGVGHMVFPNVDKTTVGPMLALNARFPEVTSVAIGLHPTEVDGGWEPVVEEMRAMLASGDSVAVGEVGMDLYWDSTYKKEQCAAFAAQLRMAADAGLPVIIHCREALEETLAVIEKTKPQTKLVFHSFTGTPGDVRRIREICDPMFGINGVVTFKNAVSLRDALPEIGLSRILLETDSPYLSPVPNRGKRNESSNLQYVCSMVASTLGISFREAEEATDNNARETFRL